MIVICRLFLLVVLAQLVVGSSDAFSDESPVFSNNPVVALVDGQPIYQDDLKSAKIHEAMVDLYQMQKNLLKEKALAKLSGKFPELKIGEISKVTDKDVTSYYESTPDVQAMGTLDELEGNIRQYLTGLNQASHFQDIDRKYKKAISKGWVVDFLKPPNDFKLVAGIGTAMVWFPEKPEKDRRIFLLEYSDFQCPFCKRVQGTLANLRKRYADDVQFGYRHFPLPFHKEASFIAEAVECARDQDKFWEFQSLVYRNADIIGSRDQLMQSARRAGISNMKQFEECWNSRKYRQRVENDIRDGIQLGIQGTPTFIIGSYDPVKATVHGEMFSGAVSEAKFISVIEKYKRLNKASVEEPCDDC